MAFIASIKAFFNQPEKQLDTRKEAIEKLKEEQWDHESLAYAYRLLNDTPKFLYEWDEVRRCAEQIAKLEYEESLYLN